MTSNAGAQADRLAGASAQATAAAAEDGGWISEGFDDLLHRIHHKENGFAADPQTGWHCDVLIIGSGYGGAVAAAALGEVLAQGPQGSDARRPQRVWLLERGQAYQPGEFPNQLAELPGHVRLNTARQLDTLGRRDGLLDVRVGDDVSVLIGNGLGGGSLINAGVMAWPQDAVFRQPPWPREIADELPTLRAEAHTMMARLGALTPDGQDNTIARQGAVPLKFDALQRISRSSAEVAAQFTPTRITVAMREGDLSPDNVRLHACNRCGDCTTGCNQGAKISLDTGLLARAARLGVKLFTGATVMRIARPQDVPSPAAPGETAGSGWRVFVHHTDPQTQWRQGSAVELRAGKVILAAGTLGSTGILLRSGDGQLRFSQQLGERFSANGDLVVAAFNQRQPVNAMASEDLPVDRRGVGPTITAMIDRRPAAALHQAYVIQDLAVPAALARVFGELNTTANTIHGLGRVDLGTHAGPHDADAGTGDPVSVDPQQLRRTFPLAIIGHDTAQGRIQLTRPDAAQRARASDAAHLPSDGAVTVSWPGLRSDPRFDTQLDELAGLCEHSGAGGVLLPNPGWKPVPKAMEFLVDGQRGPLFTAHPLGGCAMGSNHRDGVVNHLGQVFAPSGPNDKDAPDTIPADRVFPDLVVLDGAVIPTSLGINPSLTIATLAGRAMRRLIALWWDPPQAAPPAPAPVRDRPMRPATPLPAPQSTCIEIVEQLRGWAGPYGIELSLRFKEVSVDALLRGQPLQRTLALDPSASFVRVIQRPTPRPRPWLEHEAWESAPVLLRARLGGHMLALHRARSSAPQRIVKAGASWLLNRGLRDITQHVLRQMTGLTPPDLTAPDNLARLHSAVALASHGGEVRLMDYDLVIEEVLEHRAEWAAPDRMQGQHIRGRKRLTYQRRGNPWEQLMTLALEPFPGLPWPTCDAPVLKLDLAHLAKIGIPLVRITRQRDMPSALMDLASLGLLFARLLLKLHVWTLRAADPAPPRTPQRLPAMVPGLPLPQVTELDVDPPLADGTPVRVRLTRYPAATPGQRARPLVMLHGYSASGTTFAHHSVQPGLAKFLWDRGHDIWLVDMRTSAGMPTATHPWVFEDTAFKDIPVALGHVADACGSARVDVFAHCMGSAMLWMGLLAPPTALHALPGAAAAALQRLQGDPRRGTPSLVQRLAMSQIAPLVRFREGNLFRSFLMRYLRHYLPLGPYRFHADPDAPEDEDPNLLQDQVLQRLLASLPYPEEEFGIENPLFPPWKTTPWVHTRRRMDALYGRDFNLRHIGQPVLDFIDDHFGPLNLDTLSQTLHLARNQAISDRNGRNVYLSQPRLAGVLDGIEAMMSVHGVDNGLSDIRGVYDFRQYVADLGPRYAAKYTVHAIEDRGHQDCLIGIDAAERVFPRVADFFQRGATAA